MKKLNKAEILAKLNYKDENTVDFEGMYDNNTVNFEGNINEDTAEQE